MKLTRMSVFSLNFCSGGVGSTKRSAKKMMITVNGTLYTLDCFGVQKFLDNLGKFPQNFQITILPSWTRLCAIFDDHRTEGSSASTFLCPTITNGLGCSSLFQHASSRLSDQRRLGEDDSARIAHSCCIHERESEYPRVATSTEYCFLGYGE